MPFHFKFTFTSCLFIKSYRQKLSSKIPRLSNSLRKRRLQFAGHCLWALDKPVSHMLFWTPKWRPFIPWAQRQEIHHLSWQHLKGPRSWTHPQLMLDKPVAWRKFVTASSIIPSNSDRWWWWLYHPNVKTICLSFMMTDNALRKPNEFNKAYTYLKSISKTL